MGVGVLVLVVLLRFGSDDVGGFVLPWVGCMVGV